MTDPYPTEPDVRPDPLPCGHDPLDVDDRARAGRSTEHERTCPYCQGVIAAGEPAGRAATALVEAEAATPVPDTLLGNVMRTVWSELRRGTAIPLQIDAGPATAFIADHAVATLVENALDDVVDLQIHTCRVHIEPPVDDAPATDVGPRMAVDVTAAVAYASDVERLAEQARGVVRRTLHDQLGWTVDAVDVDIVDVYVPEGRER